MRAGRAAARRWRAFAAMAGSVLGAALQLQQAALWHGAVYAGLLGVGSGRLARAACDALGAAGRPATARWPCWVGAMAGGGSAGWRAAAYAAGAPARGGRGARPVGRRARVAGMPQHGAGGTRFRLRGRVGALGAGSTDGEGAAARAGAHFARLVRARAASLWGRARNRRGTACGRRPPPCAPASAGGWRCGSRRRTAAATPTASISELWMWEQGEQASGQVRNRRPRCAQPERLASTWRHPVERLREAVRDAIFEQRRRAAPGRRDRGAGHRRPERHRPRGDWDVFRATGVAHLMSISGLHITMFAWLAALGRRRAVAPQHPPDAALAGAAGRPGRRRAAGHALRACSAAGACLRSARCWMLATVALLRLTGRRWPWPFVLAAGLRGGGRGSTPGP